LECHRTKRQGTASRAPRTLAAEQTFLEGLGRRRRATTATRLRRTRTHGSRRRARHASCARVGSHGAPRLSWGPTGRWFTRRGPGLLDWMLLTTSAADAAGAYGTHAPPRHPRGLIRTACADAAPLAPAAPRQEAPLAPPNARMHRIQESFVKMDGAICRMRPDTAHASGWAPRGGGTIEDACGGRWFSRLSRSLLVGRTKNHFVAQRRLSVVHQLPQIVEGLEHLQHFLLQRSRICMLHPAHLTEFNDLLE